MSSTPRGYCFVSLALVLCLLAAASAFAQTAPKRFDVELVVNRGELKDEGK